MIGSGFSYQMTAENIGGGGASNVVATITLPAGVEFAGVSSDRGQPCTGTTVLTCNLDFLNGPLVAHIHVAARVRDAGSLVATIALTASQADANMVNNTASATTTVASPSSSTPVVVSPAPRLARVGVGQVKPVYHGTAATIGLGLVLSRAASVRLTVGPSKGTTSLTLLPGTRVGRRALKTRARAATALVVAGRFGVAVVVDRRALSRRKSYVAKLVATAADGQTGTLTLRFRG